jgi:hypothetical protein
LNTLGWNIQKLKIVSTVHRVDSLAHVNCIRFQIKLNPLHIWQNKNSKSITYLYYIALLNILFLKIYVQSWLVAHENLVSVGSFLVPGNCKNAECCTIYPRASGACRKATSARWGMVTTFKQIWVHYILG